jgi:hypothetical protein
MLNVQVSPSSDCQTHCDEVGVFAGAVYLPYEPAYGPGGTGFWPAIVKVSPGPKV